MGLPPAEGTKAQGAQRHRGTKAQRHKGSEVQRHRGRRGEKRISNIEQGMLNYEVGVFIQAKN